jgi:streptomycin 6-kinase
MILDVRPFELPHNLIASIDRDDPHREELAAWAAALPQTLARASARWSLELGPPFQPGGAGSYVVPARTAGGARVVLKLGRQHDEARDEAEGLRLWDGAGAVRLLDSALDGSTSALLLEACEPGTPLSQLAGPAEQDEIIAGLLRRLWIEPPPGHGFRPLSEMCAAWAAELEQRFGPASCPGVDLFRRLPASGSRTVLLCTDLHHGNVLAAAREPWLMIDPKPYVGDPAYDALQHMINFPDRLAADPVAFTERMAGLLDLDAGRLLEWVYARCAIESPTWPELTPVVERLAGSLR